MTHVLDFLQHAGVGPYAIAFIATAMESLAFVGLFVPGAVIVLGLGALAITGEVSLWALVVVGTAGAILGDGVSYEWGRAGSTAFGRRFDAQRRRGEAFFRKYGALSICIGRFIGPVRPIIPFVAGAARMPRLRFYLVNVLSAAAWSVTYFGAGYLLGSASHALLVGLGRGALAIALVLAAVGVLIWGTRWVIRSGPDAAASLHAAWNRTADRPRVRAFAQRHPRLISFLRARVSRAHFTGRPLTIFVVLLLYVAALLAGLAQDYVSGDPITVVDRRVAAILTALRTAGAIRFFAVVTQLGSWIVVTGGAAALAALLWRERQRVLAAGVLLTLLTAQLANALAKVSFQRPRPDALFAVVVEDSFSFPSGHATSAAAFFGFLAYALVRSRMRWRARVVGAMAMLAVVPLVDASRLVLGVHYLSDVLAGNLLGLLALLAGIAIIEWRHHLGERAVAVRPAVVGVSMLLLPLLAGVALVVEPAPRVLTPPQPVATISSASVGALLTGNVIPAQTETLIGGSYAPVTVLFVGERSCLDAALGRIGWQLARSPSADALMDLLVARVIGGNTSDAPVMPTFYQNRVPDLAFTPTHAPRGRHLRVWQLPYRTEAGDVFVGSVTDDGEFSLDEEEPWTATSAAASAALVSDLRRAPVTITVVDGATFPTVLVPIPRCHEPAAPAG